MCTPLWRGTMAVYRFLASALRVKCTNKYYIAYSTDPLRPVVISSVAPRSRMSSEIRNLKP